MHDPVKFGVFDPKAEVAISQHDLPHWFQSGVATFITFRTKDSLPAEVIDRWQREQADWLARNVAQFSELGVAGQTVSCSGDGDNASSSRGAPNSENSATFSETAKPAVPPQLQREFQKLRWQLWHSRLDEGHGECLLRQPELAEIVGDTLRHFDGERYDLDSFVVMPNHVHLLAQFRPGVDLRKQCGEWLRFSARKINARMNRRGAFWQAEPFDHLVRSPEQFAYLQNYIAENPQKANLAAGTFLYWRHHVA